MVTGKFIHLDSATLAAMLTDWLACHRAISTGHQSYSIANRSFTRADLHEVSDQVAELSYALALKSGTVVRTVVSDMSC